MMNVQLKKKHAYRCGIVGATGAVGVEILRVLERRCFPVESLKLLASSRSAGKTLEFKQKPLEVKSLEQDSFEGLDLVFFSAGASRTKEFAESALRAGAVIVDNSSAYRMKEDVPLVVPEVNPEDLLKGSGLYANPNCCAAILAVAIWPLHRAAGIKRIDVATYQSASGAGAQAMEELKIQASEVLEGKTPVPKVLQHQLAFNVFSHNTPIAANGYNEEENKLVDEIRKIFHMPTLPILPTCIRVPVLRAHSEAVTLELEKPLSAEEARDVLASAPGVKLVDDRKGNHFPMPIEASGDLDVHVGRIRNDPSDPRRLALFVSGDQLLKGAAWNAVQIAEELVKRAT